MTTTVTFSVVVALALMARMVKDEIWRVLHDMHRSIEHLIELSVHAHLEATIKSVPPDVRAAFAGEWRAELMTMIQRHMLATALAWVLRLRRAYTVRDAADRRNFEVLRGVFDDVACGA